MQTHAYVLQEVLPPLLPQLGELERTLFNCMAASLPPTISACGEQAKHKLCGSSQDFWPGYCCNRATG